MFIELGGKERQLRFDYNAVCDMETKSGMGVMKLFDENVGFNTLRLILWAGLKHDNKSLTLDMVGNFIQSHINEHGSIDDLFEKVAKAFVDSGIMGKQKQGEN
jgi:hypothetical protein